MPDPQLPDPSDPDSVGSATFDTRRRGFDPMQVRAYLTVVSRELRRARERERELTASLAELREAAASEAAPAEPVPFDEARAVELLGEETTRVLAAAREAAAEKVERAEERAAAILAEAEAQAAAIRSGASLAVEQELAAARLDGRALITEAKLVRERMLEDLAAKRHAARVQLEQMRAGRDRLAESYRQIRAALDDVAAALDDALPAAQRAARRAAQRADALPAPDAASIERELDDAARAGMPVVTNDEVEAELARADDEAPAQWVNDGAPPAEAELFGEWAPEEQAFFGDAAADAAGRATDDDEVRIVPVRPVVELRPSGETPIVRVDEPEHHEIVLASVTKSRRDAGLPREPVPILDPPDAVEEVRVLGAVAPDAAPGPSRAEPETPRPAADEVPVEEAAGEPPAAAPVDEAGEPSAEQAVLVETVVAEVAVVEVVASPRVAELAPVEAAEVAEVPVTEEPVAEEPAPEPVVEAPVAEPVAEEPAPAAEEPVAEAPAPEPVVEAPAPVDEAPVAEPVAEEPASEPAAEEPAPEPAPTRPARRAPLAEAAAAAGAVAPPAPAPAEDAPVVDDLFARIRRTREAKLARAEAVLRETRDNTAAALAGAAAPAPVVPEPVAAPVAVIDEDRAGATTPDDAARFAARDEALAGVQAQIVRKLKRLLADEQNDVLDLVRRASGQVTLDDVMPSSDDHTGRFVAAIGGELLAAVGAGAAATGDRAGAEGADLSSLDECVHDVVVAPMRVLFERAMADAVGEDELLDRLRAAYRESKGRRIDDAAATIACAAFNVGVAAALRDGRVRWAVHPVAGCCADCDDNALEGEIDAGTPFPTGATRPPGHPGCRCLLVPARQ